MAIQMRRGNLANYDEDKMLPGEFAVATDEEELYIAFGTGNSKRVLTEDDEVSQTVQNLWTGNCTTARSTSVKVVTLDNPTGFALQDGVTIGVRFSSGNNVASPQLNVNGTGAIDVNYSSDGVLYTLAQSPYYLWGTGLVFFRYASNKWRIVSADMGHVKYLNDNKAGFASPTFTGTPKAPTAAVGTSNTQIATTAFVNQSISKSKIWIGTCNTASSRQTKVVSVTGTGFQLVDGALLLVTFRYINEEANIKLNVGNTGEKPVYINGSEESVPRFFVWEPVLFTYQADNDRWAVVGGLDLRDKSRASYDSAVLDVNDRFYAVRQDASGYLSVCVPWTDTKTLTATDQGSGVVSLTIT